MAVWVRVLLPQILGGAATPVSASPAAAASGAAAAAAPLPPEQQPLSPASATRCCVIPAVKCCKQCLQCARWEGVLARMRRK